MTVIERSDRRARRFLTFAYLAAALVLWCPWRGNGIDDVFYYSYLTSLFFDGDVDVRNDYYLSTNSFDLFIVTMQFPFVDVTDRGLIRNVFAMGSPLLALPFWGVVWVAESLRNIQSGQPADWPVHRYGFAYLVAVSLARLFYGCLSLLLMYRLARYWARPRAAVWAALAAFAASPLLHYAFSANNMSHTASAFSVALMLCAALRWRRFDDPRGVALLGLAIGLAVLVRWQNILFALIPAMLWLRAMTARVRPTAGRISSLRAGLIAAAASLALISMQFFYWHAQNRHFAGIPQGSQFLKYSQPRIIEVLFSGMHGLFYWHPLLLIGALGLVFALRRRATRLIIGAGVIAFAIMIYINAAAGDWHAGGAFGARRFVSSVPLLVIGLAVVFQTASRGKPGFTPLRIAASLAILFNIILFICYQHNMLDYSFWRELWYLRPEWPALAAWIPRGAALCSGVYLTAALGDYHPGTALLLAMLIIAVVAAASLLARRGARFLTQRHATSIAIGAALLIVAHNAVMLTTAPVNDPTGLALRSFLWRSPAAHREVVREIINADTPYEPAILFAYYSLELDDYPTTRALVQMEQANPWVWAKWVDHLDEPETTPGQREKARAFTHPLPFAYTDIWREQFDAARAAGDLAEADRWLRRMLSANPLHTHFLNWRAENLDAMAHGDFNLDDSELGEVEGKREGTISDADRMLEEARRLRERRRRALMARVENYVRLAEAHPDMAVFIIGDDVWQKARILRQMNYEENLPERDEIITILTRAADLTGDDRLKPKR